MSLIAYSLPSKNGNILKLAIKLFVTTANDLEKYTVWEIRIAPANEIARKPPSISVYDVCARQ